MGLCGSSAAGGGGGGGEVPGAGRAGRRHPGDGVVSDLLGLRGADKIGERVELSSKQEGAASELAAVLLGRGMRDGLLVGAQEREPEPVNGGAAVLPRAAQTFVLGRDHVAVDAAWLLNDLMRAVGDAAGAELSEFDLWHAHLSVNEFTRSLCVLFHAHSFPARNHAFPYDLGPCQESSGLQYDADKARRRNVLLVARQGGVAGMWRLDAGDGSRVARELETSGAPLFTVAPDALGTYIGDVYKVSTEPLMWAAQTDAGRAACSAVALRSNTA